MTRDELIAALETATGPDRELDAEIAFQIGAFDRYLMGMNDCHIVSVTPARNNCAEILIRADARTTGGVQYTSDLPAYTASIDVAVSLVPDGWEWCVYGAGGSDVWQPEGLHAQQMTYAATPALSLCIAALKARPE